MSDAAAEGEAEHVRDEIWVEKYRPERLDDIAGQEHIVERLQSYVEKDELPHLLFTGQAGIGKCITAETPVLTNRGIERIENVVGDADGFEQPPDGLQVLSLVDDEFDYVSPLKVFGKTASETVELRTRDGADSTVTPEHKFLTLTTDGLEWKPAANLAPGDRIARPRKAPAPPTDISVDWPQTMDPERTVVRLGRNAADELGFDEREQRLSALDAADASVEELRNNVNRIQYVRPNGERSRPITPVWEMTPDLARFVGLAVAEARIEYGRIKFYNTDDALLDAFAETAQSLFGLAPKRGVQHDVPYVELRSRSLTHFLESTFGAFPDATDSAGIGDGLVTAGPECRRAFLRAMFDGEAHVTEQGIIELTQKRADRITLLSYLLSMEGIPSRRKVEHKAATNGTGIEREYHTLYISGSANLERFADRVGFSDSTKAKRLSRNADRESNPNHDTVPTQRAATELCEMLNLPQGELLDGTGDVRGRERHLAELETVLDAASERVETAQEVLETLETVSFDARRLASVPVAWLDERSAIAPLETRREIADETGIRTDRLLEYADGRRTPTAARTVSLVTDFREEPGRDFPSVQRVQRSLRDCIERLDLSHREIATGTEFRGTDIENLLANDDHDLQTLTRFDTVADRIRSLAERMVSERVLRGLETLHGVVESDLYFDEVRRVERVEEERRVFDLTVPESRNYVAGDVPTVVHNTTAATCIARELYGEDWRENFLELNASDQRGIDVVRDRIKNFARSSFGGYDYRVIFLDEADSLTSDAQSALRRTMEQFSNNTRFILSCNYSSQIIDPIQSRCAVFRFTPLDADAVAERLRYIAGEEGIEITEDGLDALVYAADGDMRTAINGLQAAAVTGGAVDEDAVFTITATARPEEVAEMVEAALDGEFERARGTLDDLLTNKGLSGGDIIDQLHRSVWEFDIDDEDAARLLDRIGECDFRITEGANERVQLEALLASLALD